MNPTDAALDDVRRYMDEKRRDKCDRRDPASCDDWHCCSPGMTLTIPQLQAIRTHWLLLAASGRKGSPCYREYAALATAAIIKLELAGRTEG
jgi:hypothetical protein